jgi:SAM-dependent methyltransferase
VQADEYARMFRLEGDYWWFVGRRRLALRLLRRFLRESPERPTVLDLGCGTGVVSEELRLWANVVSLDMSELALGFCRRRGLGHLVQARGEALPIRTASVDAIVALDIFEHIERDVQAVQESFRVLRSGGLLVLSVPAYQSLWGPHDVALMHQRRYKRHQVRELLQDAGFEIERLSHSVFFLFPIVVGVRFFERRRRGEPKASLPPVPTWLNRTLITLQDVEASLISRTGLPWGSSVVAVARKR